jgi:protein SCO1/2/putative membrane protein
MSMPAITPARSASEGCSIPLAGASGWCRVLIACLCLGCASCQYLPQGRPPDPTLPYVGDFSFTERSGRTVTKADLLGKVWIASFTFTCCNSSCPQINATVRKLQDDFASMPDVCFVTFTVDPEHDTPEKLTQHAQGLGADPQRWFWLTGPQGDIYRLLKESFLVGVKRNEKPRDDEEAVGHSTRLVLIDQRGQVRGYYQGMRDKYDPDPEQSYQDSQAKLKRDVRLLLAPDFPLINATLNGSAGVLLVVGWVAIRLRRELLHKVCMLFALVVSAVFLGSYLYYHIAVLGGKPTHFEDQAPSAPLWAKPLYLSILFSHIILAALVVPLALFTAWQGLKDRRPRHVWIARWTLPIWLYVSVTGVVVYWMLYRLWAGG